MINLLRFIDNFFLNVMKIYNYNTTFVSNTYSTPTSLLRIPQQQPLVPRAPSHPCSAPA